MGQAAECDTQTHARERPDHLSHLRCVVVSWGGRLFSPKRLTTTMGLCRSTVSRVAPEEALLQQNARADVDGGDNDADKLPTFVLFESATHLALVPEGGSHDAPSLVVRRVGDGQVVVRGKNEARKGAFHSMSTSVEVCVSCVHCPRRMFPGHSTPRPPSLPNPPSNRDAHFHPCPSSALTPSARLTKYTHTKKKTEVHAGGAGGSGNDIKSRLVLGCVGAVRLLAGHYLIVMTSCSFCGILRGNSVFEATGFDVVRCASPSALASLSSQYQKDERRRGPPLHLHVHSENSIYLYSLLCPAVEGNAVLTPRWRLRGVLVYLYSAWTLTMNRVASRKVNES